MAAILLRSLFIYTIRSSGARARDILYFNCLKVEPACCASAKVNDDSDRAKGGLKLSYHFKQEKPNENTTSTSTRTTSTSSTTSTTTRSPRNIAQLQLHGCYKAVASFSNHHQRLCRCFSSQTSDHDLGIKRPRTAYHHFYMKILPKLKEENPGKAAKVLAKLAGEQWRMLSDEKKQVYYDQQQADRRLLLELLADYPISHVTELLKAGQITKSVYNQLLLENYGKPKMPIRNGFGAFVKLTPFQGEDHLRKCYVAYNNLPEEEKKKYEREGASIWKQYRSELKKWYKKMKLDSDEPIL